MSRCELSPINVEHLRGAGFEIGTPGPSLFANPEHGRDTAVDTGQHNAVDVPVNGLSVKTDFAGRVAAVVVEPNPD